MSRVGGFVMRDGSLECSVIGRGWLSGNAVVMQVVMI